MDNPLISVIVPVYNVESYLHSCILSLLGQTYPLLDIILVNDGSTDCGGEICDEYAHSDSRIQVIHKKNGGLSDARNYGLDVAKGDLLAFVDSDDSLHPQFMEVLLLGMQNSSVDMAICDRQIFEEDDEVKNPILHDLSAIVWQKEEGHEAISQVYRRSSVVWNRLYRKALFQDLRFPFGKIHEDEYVKHYLYDRARSIHNTTLKLYNYRMRAGSIINSKFSLSKCDSYLGFSKDRYDFSKKKNLTILQADIYNQVIRYLTQVVIPFPKNFGLLRLICTRYSILFLQSLIHSDKFGKKDKLRLLLKVIGIV